MEFWYGVVMTLMMGTVALIIATDAVWGKLYNILQKEQEHATHDQKQTGYEFMKVK